MPELAKAYVQIIPSAEGIKGNLAKIMDGEADSAGKSAGGKFGSAFGSVAKTGLAAAGVFAGAITAAGSALLKGTADAAAYGDNIDKMSQKMGLSAQAYQEWDAVMQHSGTSIESMQASMKTLANAVENNNEAFDRLGLSADYIAGLSNEALFAETITALQSVENETERTYLAGQLLGRGATELGALLNTSAEETQAMKDRVHELGGVLSDEAVKAAAAYQDSLQDMQTAFSGLSRNLLVDFLPGITSVMDGLTEIFSGNPGQGIGMISVGVGSVVDTISGLLPEFLELGSSIILSLAEAITNNLPALLSSGADAVMTIAAGLIEQLPDIIKTGLDVIVSLAMGIADNLDELIPTVVDVVLQIVDTLTDPQTLGNLVDAALAIIIALAGGLIESLPSLLEKAPEIIGNLVVALVEAAPKLVEAALKLILKLAEGLASFFYKITEKGREIVDSIKAGFQEKIDKAKEWGKDLISNFVGGITEKWEALKSGVRIVAQTVKDFLGFSEPKEGPLSNFHTFAPDMMQLFAKGIRDNEYLVEDQLKKSLDFSGALENTWGTDRVGAAVRGAGAYRFGGAPGAAAGGSAGVDAAVLAAAIRAALEGCGVYMDGNAVGKLVTRFQTNAARAFG